MNSVWIVVKLVLIYMIILPYVICYMLDKITKTKSTASEIGNGLLSVIITAVIAVVLSLMNMNFREYEYQYAQEIVAVQDSQVTVISRYSSDSDLYYYFMVKDGDGYKSRKVSQEYATIHYTEGNSKVKVYKKESTNKLIQFLIPIETYVGDYKYEFYLPKGSIKEDFNIDLN